MPDDVQVRLATADDYRAIDEVETAAFGTHSGVVVPLIEQLRATGAVAFELVAENGGTIVGHVMLSRGWLDAPPRLVDVHVLSPIAVTPGHQNQGIGRKLIDDSAIRSGESVPAIFLEGDPAYYSRVQFVPATGWGFRSPSVRIPPRAFQVRLLPTYESWMTGALVYPDAFWSSDAVGLR